MKIDAPSPRSQYRNSLTANVGGTQLREIRKTLPLRVLSEQDFQHWQTFGFVVVREAVPQDNVRRLVEFLWEFQEMDPGQTGDLERRTTSHSCHERAE